MLKSIAASGETKIWLHSLDTTRQRQEQSLRTRELLGLICDIEGIGITRNELLQPGLELIEFFSTELNLGLSLAHCPKMVAIALAPGKTGIDCETKGEHRDWLGIANRFFSAREAKVIAATGSEERESVFLRHWVLKEAWIKAQRGSISSDLNQLVVENPHSVRIENPAPDSAGWQAWELELCDCPIAVCSASSGPLLISRVDRLFSRVMDGAVQPSGASPMVQDLIMKITPTRIHPTPPDTGIDSYQPVERIPPQASAQSQ